MHNTLRTYSFLSTGTCTVGLSVDKRELFEHSSSIMGSPIRHIPVLLITPKLALTLHHHDHRNNTKSRPVYSNSFQTVTWINSFGIRPSYPHSHWVYSTPVSSWIFHHNSHIDPQILVDVFHTYKKQSERSHWFVMGPPQISTQLIYKPKLASKRWNIKISPSMFWSLSSYHFLSKTQTTQHVEPQCTKMRIFYSYNKKYIHCLLVHR